MFGSVLPIVVDVVDVDGSVDVDVVVVPIYATPPVISA
jgi:hypothetical protein